MRQFIALIALILVASLAAFACGGDRTLQLPTGPITEDEFRVQVRQAALVHPSGFDLLCRVFRPRAEPIPTPELLAVFQGTNPFTEPTPIATPAPDDEARAVEILEEECERLT